MKIDQNLLLMGGVVIIGVIALAWISSGPDHRSFTDGMRSLANMIEGGGAPLTPMEEEEQAAMYAGYY